jgi:hypothetical protein
MMCDYATMDWYCCLPLNHPGSHQSSPLTVRSPMTPPDPVLVAAVQRELENDAGLAS